VTSKEDDITSKLKNCLNIVAHSLETCSSPGPLAQRRVQSGVIFTDLNSGENRTFHKEEKINIFFHNVRKMGRFCLFVNLFRLRKYGMDCV
jgi:hypothetical protein